MRTPTDIIRVETLNCDPPRRSICGREEHDFDPVAEFYNLYVLVTDDIPLWMEVVEEQLEPRLEVMCDTAGSPCRLKAKHALEALDHSVGLLDVLEEAAIRDPHAIASRAMR